MTMVGARSTVAPASSSSEAKLSAWPRGRVTTTTRPASGLAAATDTTPSPARGGRARRARGARRRVAPPPLPHLQEHRARDRGSPWAIDACHQPVDGEHRVVHLREAGHRGMAAGAEATKEGALRLRLCPGRGIIEALEHLQHRAISTARLHAEDPLPHCGEKLVRGEDLDVL